MPNYIIFQPRRDDAGWTTDSDGPSPQFIRFAANAQECAKLLSSQLNLPYHTVVNAFIFCDLDRLIDWMITVGYQVTPPQGTTIEPVDQLPTDPAVQLPPPQYYDPQTPIAPELGMVPRDTD